MQLVACVTCVDMCTRCLQLSSAWQRRAGRGFDGSEINGGRISGCRGSPESAPAHSIPLEPPPDGRERPHTSSDNTLGHTSGDLIFLKTMPYYLRPYHNKSHTLGGALPLDGSLILSSILPGSLLALSYETSIKLGTFFHKLCQRDQSSSARTRHKRATSKWLSVNSQADQ